MAYNTTVESSFAQQNICDVDTGLEITFNIVETGGGSNGRVTTNRGKTDYEYYAGSGGTLRFTKSPGSSIGFLNDRYSCYSLNCAANIQAPSSLGYPDLLSEDRRYDASSQMLRAFTLQNNFSTALHYYWMQSSSTSHQYAEYMVAIDTSNPDILLFTYSCNHAYPPNSSYWVATNCDISATVRAVRL
jgi:hypothetical protein